MIKISPSILAGDFGDFANEAKRAEQAGADFLHIDVMDGHFVPNLTFGPDVVKALRKAVSIPLDVHLMMTYPQKYIEAFVQAGADIVTTHIESDHNLSETMDKIHQLGAKTGPVLNPDTPLNSILEVLPKSDIVLVMSVFPGFGGQSFMPEVLDKVQKLKDLRKEYGYSFEIEIDGGINNKTIDQAKNAGIDIAVAGTAVFGTTDISKAIANLR